MTNRKTEQKRTPRQPPSQPPPGQAQHPRQDREGVPGRRGYQSGRDQDRDGVVGSENDDSRHR